MGFCDYYVYQETPLPFTRRYRASLNVDENELSPLTVNNYIIPTVFVISGYLISFFIFCYEKLETKKMMNIKLDFGIQ